jgi:hypothetical protein
MNLNWPTWESLNLSWSFWQILVVGGLIFIIYLLFQVDKYLHIKLDRIIKALDRIKE